VGFEVLTTKISVFLDVITFHSDDGGSSFLQMTNYPFEIATDHMGPLVINMMYLSRRGGGSTVVKVLCYESEGRWFDSRWCHWDFSLI
jgi:hypothetical protein